MTYLEMCQKMIRDLGLQNAVNSVESQTGMSAKIVDWVADADVAIQSLWQDWNFLWKQSSVETISSTREVSAPSDLGSYDLNSFYLDYTTDDYTHLQRLDYKEWRELYRQGTQTNDEPNHFVLLPNNNIYLEPAPDKVYTLTCDYWKVPTRMTVNTSLSAIPVRFQRIILALAKIYYAEHEEFPTVFELATKEYNGLLQLLKSAELPGEAAALKKSQNFDYDLTVVAR